MCPTDWFPPLLWFLQDYAELYLCFYLIFIHFNYLLSVDVRAALHQCSAHALGSTRSESEKYAIIAHRFELFNFLVGETAATCSGWRECAEAAAAREPAPKVVAAGGWGWQWWWSVNARVKLFIDFREQFWRLSRTQGCLWKFLILLKRTILTLSQELPKFCIFTSFANFYFSFRS